MTRIINETISQEIKLEKNVLNNKLSLAKQIVKLLSRVIHKNFR